MPRVLVLSDLHLRSTAEGRVRGVETRRGLLRALRHAAGQGPFDRLVLTGDLAEEPLHDTYLALREALAGFPEPLVLAGNHDALPELCDVFPRRAEAHDGRVGFVDEVGGWRLIGLDSHFRRQVRGRLGNPQLAWLARALESDPRPVVLFVHHPPVRVDTWWLDGSRLADADGLAAVIAHRGRVRAVVHGHVHMASEGALAGARVLGVPSTAFPFAPRSLLPRRAGDAAGYRILELGDDSFASSAITV